MKNKKYPILKTGHRKECTSPFNPRCREDGCKCRCHDIKNLLGGYQEIIPMVLFQGGAKESYVHDVEDEQMRLINRIEYLTRWETRGRNKEQKNESRIRKLESALRSIYNRCCIMSSAEARYACEIVAQVIPEVEHE